MSISTGRGEHVDVKIADNQFVMTEISGGNPSGVASAYLSGEDGPGRF